MSKKVNLTHSSLKEIVCESFDAALKAAIPHNKQENPKYKLNESQLRQYVRHVLKEMDYDSWKTQTPEEYFGYGDESLDRYSTSITLSEVVYDACCEVGMDDEEAEEYAKNFEFDDTITTDYQGEIIRGEEVYDEIDQIQDERIRKIVKDTVDKYISEADYDYSEEPYEDDDAYDR
jgi:hypothetical protein